MPGPTSRKRPGWTRTPRIWHKRTRQTKAACAAIPRLPGAPNPCHRESASSAPRNLSGASACGTILPRPNNCSASSTDRNWCSGGIGVGRSWQGCFPRPRFGLLPSPVARSSRRQPRKISFCRGEKWCSISPIMSQTHPLTTTTFELPGYRVVNCFGVVRGIVVRSRSIVGNFGAHLQSLFGGNISLYTSLCERTREDAFNQMITHAGELGANAVVGVRYDATEIGAGITEVLCYGTAVYVERAG